MYTPARPVRCRPRALRPAVPYIPFPTTARLGAQPFAAAASYKLAAYATGDFAGANLVTTITRNLRLVGTYVALSVHGGWNGHWTPNAIQENALQTGLVLIPVFTGQTANAKSNFIGNEIFGGLTWRFAPGLALDSAVGYIVGGACAGLDRGVDAQSAPRAELVHPELKVQLLKRGRGAQSARARSQSPVAFPESCPWCYAQAIAHDNPDLAGTQHGRDCLGR